MVLFKSSSTINITNLIAPKSSTPSPNPNPPNPSDRPPQTSDLPNLLRSPNHRSNCFLLTLPESPLKLFLSPQSQKTKI